jgi:hypothetical protein
MCQWKIAVLSVVRNVLLIGGVLTGAVVVGMAIAGTAAIGAVAVPAFLFLGAGVAHMFILGLSGALAPRFRGCLDPTLVRRLAECGTEAPAVMETLRDHERKILENASASGTAILSASTAAADAVAQVAVRVTTTPSTAPKGGTVLAGSRLDAAAATREMINFQGPGNNTVVTRIGVLSTQSTKTLVEAQMTAPDIRWFDGAYTGTISLTSTQPGVAPFSGGFAFTVAGGRLTVSAPGSGSGTVSAAGGVRAGFGMCVASGALVASSTNGAATDGGAAFCQGGGLTGGGPWSATRAARP